MDEINNIIAVNLVKLRKKNKLTQAELAEQIHYSDKSISKWEKGESCPSIAVANEISKYYGITLNDLIDENLDAEEIQCNEVETRSLSYSVITLLACSVVWLIAAVIFVYGTLVGLVHSWLTFVCAIPITCIVLLIFNSLWGNRRKNYHILSVLNWTLLSSIFLLVLFASEFKYVLWVIFIIGIPVQISIILWSQLKRTPKSDSALNISKKRKSRKKSFKSNTEVQISENVNNGDLNNDI